MLDLEFLHNAIRHLRTRLSIPHTCYLLLAPGQTQPALQNLHLAPKSMAKINEHLAHA